MASTLPSIARHLIRRPSNIVTSRALASTTTMAKSSFLFDHLSIERTSQPRPKPKPPIIFGTQYSDHMLSVEWSEANGWDRPSIAPLRNLSLHPGAKVLHFATELFEGMKAYRGDDDRIRIFRPHDYMRRMNASAVRASLPTFDGAELVRCIARLVETENDWVPSDPASALYIRPVIIGTGQSIKVCFFS